MAIPENLDLQPLESYKAWRTLADRTHELRQELAKAMPPGLGDCWCHRALKAMPGWAWAPSKPPSFRELPPEAAPLARRWLKAAREENAAELAMRDDLMRRGLLSR